MQTQTMQRTPPMSLETNSLSARENRDKPTKTANDNRHPIIQKLNKAWKWVVRNRLQFYRLAAIMFFAALIAGIYYLAKEYTVFGALVAPTLTATP